MSELESKEWGTPAVTPKDISPVDELLGLGLGEKIKIFYSKQQNGSVLELLSIMGQYHFLLSHRNVGKL